jgi:hypothetical protein
MVVFMEIKSNNIFDRYFYVWALFLPITSVLVIPSIQGTLPSYLFALFSIIFVPFITKLNNIGQKFLKDFLIYLYILILINACAQLGLTFIYDIDFSNVRLLNPEDDAYLLRSTLITQSLYLTAGVATFIYVKNFYKERWDKKIYYGVIFLALYGIYEVIYFFIFKQNGDFLSNRMWDGEHAGSLFQTTSFGSLVLLRLKSLTGEPSMYAFTVLPFWIYAIHTGRKFTQVLLLVTLVLSTSTTAFLGILIYVLLRIYYFKFRDIFTWIFTTIFALLAMFKWDVIYLAYQQFIYSKITLNGVSGIDRFNSFTSSINFFKELPVWNQFFGVGFGYIRSTDLFSTLLVNTGYIGVIVFSFVILFPIFKLGRSYREIGIKCALFVIFVTSMVSVPEFAYLSIWLFLGMAYNQITKNKKFKSLIKKGKRTNMNIA